MIDVKELVLQFANDAVPAHQNAMSMQESQVLCVNEYGEITPFLSDVDVKNKHSLFLCNATKMSEDMYDILEVIARDGKNTRATIVFTTLGYSQEIVDMDDLTTMCDVLELINS